jgi:hypothetical protein
MGGCVSAVREAAAGRGGSDTFTGGGGSLSSKSKGAQDDNLAVGHSAGAGSSGRGFGSSSDDARESLASPRNVAVDKASALGVPEDAARERGCYLVFTPASGGALIAHWSETAVPDAWAFFYPRANVAGFKFKQNSGRVELIRGIAVGKIKVFNGWGQFFKLAYDNDGIVRVNARDDVMEDIWFLGPNQTVGAVTTGQWFEAKKMAVVGIIPHHNQSFVGVMKTDENRFIDTAKGALGYAWKPIA